MRLADECIVVVARFLFRQPVWRGLQRDVDLRGGGRCELWPIGQIEVAIAHQHKSYRGSPGIVETTHRRPRDVQRSHGRWWLWRRDAFCGVHTRKVLGECREIDQ